MIASLYGMNVSLPGEGAKYAFSVIVILIVGLSILSLILFQRKKWL
jgi:Mg2+ and Co2+ transporter CorA